MWSKVMQTRREKKKRLYDDVADEQAKQKRVWEGEGMRR